MQELIQFANDRPTALNDDLYQWAVDAEDHIRTLVAEQENLRRANLDCIDHFNQLKEDYDKLQVEHDKYQKLLMRWCNESMDTAQVKQLETETILTIKGKQ